MDADWDYLRYCLRLKAIGDRATSMAPLEASYPFTFHPMEKDEKLDYLRARMIAYEFRQYQRRKSMNITMQGKYQTRDGRAVRILATDVKGDPHPVYGLIAYPSGVEILEKWMANGHYYGVCGESSADLVPVPTKHEGWMVFDKSSYALYTRKEGAEAALRQDIGSQVSDIVAHVTWED